MQWNSLRRYFCSIFDYRTNQTQSFDWVRLPNVTVRVVTGIVVLGSKNCVEFTKKVSPCFHSRLLAAYFAETMPFQRDIAFYFFSLPLMGFNLRPGVLFQYQVNILPRRSRTHICIIEHHATLKALSLTPKLRNKIYQKQSPSWNSQMQETLTNDHQTLWFCYVQVQSMTAANKSARNTSLIRSQSMNFFLQRSTVAII